MVDVGYVQDSVRCADDQERAAELLRLDRVEEAIQLLERSRDPSGQRDALLGAAYFRSERYDAAAHCFAKAMEKGESGPELAELRARSKANHAAEVHVHVPDPVAFIKEQLLSGPQPGQTRADLPPLPQPGLGDLLIAKFGTALGVKLGHAIHRLSVALGRERPGQTWSSWYTEPLLRALLMLVHRRERLDREQLFDAYSSGPVGFFETKARAPGWTEWVRTDDGSYNDPERPMAGAAGVRFGFNTDPTATPGEVEPRLLTPNPRRVSRVLMTRSEGFKPVEFLNLNAASWIQFMTHDWVSYGDALGRETYRIELDVDDPVRQALHQTHFDVKRTQRDPTRRDGEPGPTHINEVTAWWDGSQLYGSDSETQRRVRSLVGGKLAVDPTTGNLPLASDKVEQTGFRRNWWLGLSMMHNLFTKEHNAICDMLAVNYPHWPDQRLFDVARLINAAVMAKIHTVEWTPAILPNRALNMAMNGNWYGVLANLFTSRRSRETVSKFNIADPVVGGIVGNQTRDFGVPYSLTREFTSVYRLHPLLPDEISIWDLEHAGRMERRGLAELRQAAVHDVTRRHSMASLFYSFGRQYPGRLELNNYPATLQNLSIPGAGFYDLAAVDVLRDRERGIPRYNQFRRLMGLTPITAFSDLTDDPEQLQALESVYDSVEDIDLLIGNLAEAHRPTGFGFGETLFEVFIVNASRRLQADRFFTTHYRADVYTQEGLDWIDQASFKGVLLRHHPELAATGLANVDNAFEPWDTGVLDPKRHPLRAFDRELQRADRWSATHG